jgi:hypothetical protein
MTNLLTVKPVRTFFDGEVLRTRRSQPYGAERSKALQLIAQGLVVRHDEVVASEPTPDASPTPARKRGKGTHNDQHEA